MELERVVRRRRMVRAFTDEPVAPDVLELALPTAGAVTTQFAVPANPGLVGAVLHLQVLPFETTPGGSLLTVTGTNRLSLTLGVF